MTDYNNKRYSSRGSGNTARSRSESEYYASRRDADDSRRYGYDVRRASARRQENAYDDRYESRYQRRYDDRYDDRYESRYNDRYDDRYGSYRQPGRSQEDARYERGGSYRAPQRRPEPPQKKPDRSALIVLTVLVVFIIAAIVLCVNVLGGRKADKAASQQPVATWTPVPTVQATASPTPQPTATPTPAPRMSPEYTVLEGIPNTDRELGLQESVKVDDSYFDRAVFIGDSVTLKLNYFVRDSRKEDYPTLLGSAQFLTAGSLGSGEALKPLASDSLHPSYMGQKMLLEDSVAAMGAQKVFIMLGMNDVALYGVEESARNMMTLIRRIVDKSPGIQVFVQSATPRIEGDYNKLNNNALFEYNLKLYEYCLQLENSGVYFVDVAHVMRDEKGNLPLEYCSDADGMGLHFTSTACKEWINYLYTHALV